MANRRCLIVLLMAPISAYGQNSSPTISAVLNAGSLDTRLSPGCGATIFGTNLGPAQGVLGTAPGLSVTANGKPAPVLFSSAAQVNIQLPYDLPIGPANIQLLYQGLSSAPSPIQVVAYAPALASRGGNGAGAVLFFGANQSFASPGEVITLFAYGLGQTSPPVTAGQAVTTPTPTAVKPIVTVNGELATLLFAGIPTTTPQALYQINIAVPGDLSAGSYPVVLSIGGFSSPPLVLPVNITGVTATQSGFTFQAVQGGGTPSPSSFLILNGTSQALSYSLSVSTIPAGVGWLSVSPVTGSIPTGQGVPITVSVNPANLPPGDYYGQIRIDAPPAPNSPRFLSVVLNVSAANVNPGPTLDQTGLVFISLLSGADPATQSIKITNVTSRASSFTAAVSALSTQNPFAVTPATGSVAPTQPASVSVQAKTAGLPAGAYRGSLTLQFPQDNTSRVVDLLLVITPVLITGQSEARFIEAAGACKPTKLLPVFTLLGASFNIAVAWPTPIEVKVVDDCGALLSNGSVTVTFSNGDPQISLVYSQDGRWSGTWAAVNPRSSSLTVSATARQTDLSLVGSTQIGGSAQTNPDVPILALNGMVSSGSYSAAATPSPGELVAVFGSKMADGSESASALPLPTRFQNATLTLGGRPLPLVFTSENQINAQIPYDISSGTTPQLICSTVTSSRHRSP